MSTSNPNRTITICAISLVIIGFVATGVQSQASDGDEQFEFQHQDIGRISGLSSGTSPVAPQTTVVARQQPSFSDEQAVAAPAPAPPVAVAHTTSDRSQSRHTQRHNSAGSQRKPNRVTLVARRDPVVTPAQPVPASVQLPAPPQQYAPQLQTVPSASHELAQPTFAPQPPQEPSQHSPLTVVSGPALNSFRATGGSVSPRHSVLIAQVAAERAAAASLISPQSEPAPPSAAGLPAVAPVFNSPAPVAQQGHHHRQQHSAFASFSSQLPPPQQLAPLQATFQASPSHAHAHLQHLPQASQPQAAVNQLEEPLVAPSFEHVLGHGCPHKGVFSWENKDHCDRYYMCTNGTFTEEACPNGLAYSQQGAVYQHCAYNWNVNCGNKKTALPIASPGCPWQFGIFPIVQNGRCSIDYFACEWGVPETKRCTPEGLFYDDRIKGCQWADQLGCKSEGLLNFKCPAEDEDNPYWPYPRYYHTAQDVIVCVNEQPRLVHCNEDQLVDPSSLACVEVKKKKKLL